MVKFSPTALNFGYDFVLLVGFLGHPVALSGFPKMPSFKPSTTRSTGQAMHDNKSSKVTQEVSEQRTTRRSVSYPVHSKVMGSPGAETKSPAIKLSNFEIMQQMRVVSYPYTLLQSIRLRVVDCPTQMTVDL